MAKWDTRPSVCYGCSLNFKRNGQGPLPPFDFIIVKKLRREYYNQGMKCLAAPSNAYFHAFCDNPFYQPFEYIQGKYLAFNVTHMRTHNSIIGSLRPQHLAMLRNSQLLQFLYWKDTLKYSRIYRKAQVLEIDVSRFTIFLFFVYSGTSVKRTLTGQKLLFALERCPPWRGLNWKVSKFKVRLFYTGPTLTRTPPPSYLTMGMWNGEKEVIFL